MYNGKALTPTQENEYPQLLIEPRSQDGIPRIHTDGIVPTLNTCGGAKSALHLAESFLSK